MLQPAAIVCCKRNTASISGVIVFVVAAAALPLHRIIFEKQQPDGLGGLASVWWARVCGLKKNQLTWN